MRLSSFLGLSWLSAALAITPTGYDQIHWQDFTPSTYLNSTGLTDAVQWDGYSLFVNGERVFLYSGEVHPWRLIVPELWPDIMQRIKAVGFNAISMYTFWGLYETTRGDIDLDGWKNFEPFIEAAGDAGLWVIARPGPYINAEVTAGGLPGWTTTLDTLLRTDNATWVEAVTPYWQAMGEIFARQQITQGGPIIAVQILNEYFLGDNNQGPISLPYAAHLEELMRSYGVVVPFTFNDVNPQLRLYTGEGAVDLYGVDAYPQSTDCAEPNVWKPVVTDFRPYLQNTSGAVGMPFFIPEFQGGWIPTTDTPGFDMCYGLYDSAFERLFYLNNVAQGIKMQSTYMIYGGTNFGKTAFPTGLTSYDYWAAISEDRTFKDKYYEFKLIAHFLVSSKSLTKTWVVQSDNSSISAADPIQLDVFENPDDRAKFYIVRHANSTSVANTTFEVQASDWMGNTTFPVTLYGRDARIMVTDYHWGNACMSSSASVFTSATISGTDVVILYGFPGDYSLSFNANVTQTYGSSNFTYKDGRMNATIAAGDHSILSGQNLSVHVLDTAVANFAWTVEVGGSTAVVFGPYFVRNASCSDTTLMLNGDLNATTTIYVVAETKYTALMWNGEPVNATQEAGMWTATLPGPANANASSTTLGPWKRMNSLPELEYGYDDSWWTLCNKTTTTNPNQPYSNYSGEYILYGPDYEYYSGATLFRGHYTNASALSVSISAGTPGVAAFWDSGDFVGYANVQNKQGINDVNVTIPLNHTSGVVQIVIDNAGQDENGHYPSPDGFSSEDILSPRGIRGYELVGGDTSAMEWRMIGGVDKDKVRTLFNAGGFYGEREGWYLPGYDDAAWPSIGPDQATGPGVWFYRTTVNATYPAGLDTHYSFVFPNTDGYRAQLWVNGWQFATVYADIGGPQYSFPVPPGVLKQGCNEVALSVFALNGTAVGEIELQMDQTVTTTVLDLAGLSVEAPTYQDIYG